jgi:carbon storage regulator
VQSDRGRIRLRKLISDSINNPPQDLKKKILLILTRRVNESLVVGDQVKVTVLALKGNQVRIGIDAPKHVEVHREEICKRVQQQRADENTP